MVRLKDMEDKLEDFFKRSDGFKHNKLIIDFNVEDLEDNVQSAEFVVKKPKLKKGQKAAKFIRNNPNKKSLF
tara:strand:- start:3483 stop:3698 length:216 start_codon:yes stop_codon:yes gene_type:complete